MIARSGDREIGRLSDRKDFQITQSFNQSLIQFEKGGEQVRARRLLLMTLVVILAGGSFTYGKAFGEWDTTIVISPTGGSVSFIGSQSTLRGSYFTGDVAEMSNSSLSGVFITDRGLTKTGMGVQAFFTLPMSASDPRATFSVSTYLKQDIVIDWPIGTYALLSDTDFSIADASLKHAWLECIISAYGLKGTGSFLLIPAVSSQYALGAEFSLQGTTIAGMTLEAMTTFGICADLKEITTALILTDTCFCYSGTDISFDGLTLGCLHYETLIHFSKSGFEFAQFEFGIDPMDDWPLPVSLDFTLTFMTQTKSLVVVVPTLYVGGECISVYTALDVTGNNTGGPLSFDGFSIAGLAIKGIPVGSSTLSGIISIDGVLYKTTKNDDITMRATNYVIPCDCYTSQIPTKYDLILSLEYSDGNLDSAIDLYFMPSGGSLFNLGLFTGQVSYILSSEVTFGVGAAVNPSTGLQRLTFDLSMSLYQ